MLASAIASLAQQKQLQLNPLKSNAQIIEYRKHLPEQSATKSNNRTQSVSNVFLELPFYDEFSKPGPYPDTAKWLNSQSVFVNHTKAMAPPTLGVATFDGLNQFGNPYFPSIASSTASTLASNPSDTLTSQPIRLDSIPSISHGLAPIDSVYLSFYYQGQGFWEKPENTDGIALDFYNPTDTTPNAWAQVWTHPGYTYAPDSSWHIVMIPIIDTMYFKKGFQFRFRNQSSGSGDVDHWHIDVVSLVNNRNYKDTIFGDFSFVYDLGSALKNYSQMPYNQYTGAPDMSSHISAFLRNNSNDINHQNISTRYNCYNTTAGSFWYNPSVPLGSINLGYYYNVGYCSDSTLIHPAVNFMYPTLSAPNLFAMKFFTDAVAYDTIQTNDTASFIQNFDNFFAYDDGSAEAGVAINPYPGVTGETAVRYVLNVADTLRSVDIFFDPVIDVDLLKSSPFNFIIRTDNAGLPGNILYQDTVARYPYFPVDSLVPGVQQRENSFLRYQLSASVALPAGTTFYVSIAQTYTTPLNIGFDMNTDFHRNMFYNADGTDWYVFPGDLDPDYRGSLMIRPVFGTASQAAGIQKYNTSSANISLYPNPAGDYVYIRSDKTISEIVITDLLGNIVLQQTADAIQKINTLSLPSGVYLVKAFTDKGFADTRKLIIAK